MQLYFHDNALRGCSLDHRLGLVGKILIHGFPDTWHREIIMGEDDTARAHAGIEKFEAFLRALIGVHVKVDKREMLVFYRVRCVREDTFVQEDVFLLRKIGLYVIIGRSKFSLVKRPDLINVVNFWQAGNVSKR